MPYHHMNGYDWFWAVPMMLFWVVVVGAVVYVAVRLANEHSQNRR